MKKIIPFVIVSITILSACDSPENATTNNNTTTAVTTVLKEDAVAIVNGKYISKVAFAQLEQEIKQRSPNHNFPKEKLIEELIQRELLIQDAINKKLDQSTEFTERMAEIKKSLLSQTAIQNFIKSNPVSDAELEAEYNKNVAETGTEYKARHILLKTEEDAKQLINELTQGADFIELAKAKSTGPSGPQGGDLGWFTATQMVAPFSEAAIALEDGKFTTEPVQTQFGWHVILKESSRAITPPSLDSVKEKIRPMLQRQKMQEFMATLHKQAKIEILLPKEAAADTKAEEPVATDEKKAMEAVTESAKKATDMAAESMNDTATKAVEKAELAVETISKEATSVVDKAVAEIKDKVTETASTAKEEASEKAKKALDSVMP